jgi:hypothetical protein
LSNHLWRMLETHPSGAAVDSSPLVHCIQACFECEQTCTTCADACLGEKDVQTMIRCIRLNLDCASVCGSTGKILSRQTVFDTQVAQATLEACVRVCRICGEECERHAEHHEHCRVCAEACFHCESTCNNLLSAIGG